jgi:hypothetical protein
MSINMINFDQTLSRFVYEANNAKLFNPYPANVEKILS